MSTPAAALTFADPAVAAQLGYAPVSAETVAGTLGTATDPTPAPSSTEGSVPVPTMRPDLEVTDVSPGLAGFLAIFVVAVAAILLMLSMTRKLRKVNHSQGADPQASAVFDDRISSDQRDRRS
jgi:hypothetical protein